MTKKIRPSLKDYLKTGEVRFEAEENFSQEALPSSPPAASKPNSAKAVKRPSAISKPAGKKTPSKRSSSTDEPSKPLLPFFLELLDEKDRIIWEPIVRAGIDVQELPIDFVAAREDIRTMDRNRFTCFLLPAEREPLRPVRTSVQIREPLLLLFRWDEMGSLLIYRPVA